MDNVFKTLPHFSCVSEFCAIMSLDTNVKPDFIRSNGKHFYTV